MSLLQNLSYQDYNFAANLPRLQCEIIAKLANIDLMNSDTKKPGEVLMKYLDRRGCSVKQYRQILNKALTSKTILTYYKPQSKVAILIANSSYEHLSKLVTPSIDCDALRANFKSLGFITILFKNTTALNLKNSISKVIEQIPEDSYCFIFYAGHGCELCNTRCILGIDCPTDKITAKHCITENWLLHEVAKCKPELCVLIMDMCRNHLNRETNEDLYNSMMNTEECTVHSNLLVAYSTQSCKAAYEVLQIECSSTIDNNITYELKTEDMDKVVPGTSQYVYALCSRLLDNYDVSTLLDKVHEDLENCMKKQRPIKVQCGVAKRSLYDPVKGDTSIVLDQLCKLAEKSDEHFTVF